MESQDLFVDDAGEFEDPSQKRIELECLQEESVLPDDDEEEEEEEESQVFGKKRNRRGTESLSREQEMEVAE